MESQRPRLTGRWGDQASPVGWLSYMQRRKIFLLTVFELVPVVSDSSKIAMGVPFIDKLVIVEK